MKQLHCLNRIELALAAGLVLAIGAVLAAIGRFELFPIALPIAVALYVGVDASRRR